MSSYNLPILLKGHEAGLFSLLFLLLYVRVLNKPGGVCAVCLADGSVPTQTSDSEGTSSSPSHTQTHGQREPLREFSLKSSKAITCEVLFSLSRILSLTSRTRDAML